MFHFKFRPMIHFMSMSLNFKEFNLKTQFYLRMLEIELPMHLGLFEPTIPVPLYAF
jgi:hypothetical protein